MAVPYGWTENDIYKQVSIESEARLTNLGKAEVREAEEKYLQDLAHTCLDVGQLAIPKPMRASLQLSGSTAEGNFRFQSDVDGMIEFCNVVAYDGEISFPNIENTEKTTLLVCTEDCPPGHCMLELINQGTAFTFYAFSSNLPYVQYNGKTFLSSFQLKYLTDTHLADADLADRTTKQTFPMASHARLTEVGFRGPALFTYVKNTAAEKVDMAYMVRLNNWPKQGLVWLDRERRYGWPTEEMLKKAKETNILLVPAGQKGHRNEDLQWTFAFTNIERDLIFQFNPTQRRCYMILKKIAREHITPVFGDDKISSYCIKNTLFWCIEDSPSAVWVPENLLSCLHMCLENIVLMLQENKCPSYFIPEKNLFLGKVSSTESSSLLSAVRGVIDKLPNIIADFCDKSTDCIKPHVKTRINSLQRRIREYLARSMISNYFKMALLGLEGSLERLTEASIHSMHGKVLTEILQLPKRPACFQERIDLASAVISSLGLHLISLAEGQGNQASYNNHEELKISGQEHLMCASGNYLGASLVKLANYFLLEKSRDELFFVTNKVLDGSTQLSCEVPYLSIVNGMLVFCKEEMKNIEDENTAEETTSDKHRNWLDVYYLPGEIRAIPDALKIEMCKPFVKSTDMVQMFFNFSKRWAVVDPMINAAFLQFIWAHRNCELETRRKALSTLTHLCTKTTNECRPSSLNLLGYCYFQMRLKNKAVQTFRRSISVNQENAAYWHMAVFVYREILNEWKQTT